MEKINQEYTDFLQKLTEGKGIIMYQDDDGNWKGEMVKFGKSIKIRDVGPDTVLQRLLTSSGD